MSFYNWGENGGGEGNGSLCYVVLHNIAGTPFLSLPNYPITFSEFSF